MATSTPADKPSRKPQLNITASAEEIAAIEKLAKRQGLTISGLLRMLALNEARRQGIIE